MMADEQATLAAMTAEIVSAYVSHNQITTGDLADLISSVAGQLGSIGTEPEQPADVEPEPAVPVRRSIRPDHLVCLICGKKQKLLKRHLAVEHDLTPHRYRETFGLGRDYPMASPNYVQRRRELAMQIGLGRPKKPARKGRKPASKGATAEPKQPEVGAGGS